MSDYILRNGEAKVQTVAPLETCMRFVKHECPDGDYSIESEQTGQMLLLYRIQGVVYPCGGMLNGEVVPPRSKDECKATFG